MRRRVRECIEYIRVSNIDEIARRYFVMNAFDGALTMLGILVGAYLSGSEDTRIIISAGIGASIAMGVSGFTGAYMTERAERMRELRELEDAMLLDLNGTMHGKAGRFASVFTAFVDGISPAVAAFIIISPFTLITQGVLDFGGAYAASMVVTLLMLFGLGAYLAKISNESMLRNGLMMILVGMITAAVIYVTSVL